MVKLVSMDLDGTLLSTNKVMTKSFKPFVEKLKSKGIVPIVATGREYFMANKFLGDTDIDIVCNNGNVIRNNLTGKTSYVNPIDKKDVLEIMSFDKSAEIISTIHILRDDGVDLLYRLKENQDYNNSYVNVFAGRNLGVKDFLQYDGEPLSIVFVAPYEVLKDFKEVLEEKIGDRFNIHLMKIVSKPYWMLEVLQKNGDKLFGVKKFIEDKNIDLKNIISIGDDSNDKMLIESSGVGIAMKNGVNELKKVADIISDYDNDNDGAIKILDKVIFGWCYEYKLVSRPHEKDNWGYWKKNKTCRFLHWNNWFKNSLF